ncbi:MAG: hypothetical protein U0176_24280 [Bacteroidia bacterium]
MAAILACLLPAFAEAQFHTVHAQYSPGPDGFSSGALPNTMDYRQGYLAVAEDRDAGGSAWDICVMWGDTCRGYDAKSRWYRTAGNNDDGTWAVKMDATGDMWVAATSTGTGLGGQDAVIMKLDTATNLPIQWAKAYGGTGDETFFSIKLTSDGGAIAVGGTNGFGAQFVDGYIVKVDASGNLQWARRVGGSSTDQLADVVQTSDGGYLVLGVSFSYSPIMNLLLLKLTSTGTLTFAKILDNPVNRWSVGTTLHRTLDGGYILGGAEVNGNISPNDADGMLVKLDAAYNVQWTKLYGGPGWDDLLDFTPTDDNGDQIRDDGYLAVGANANLSATDDYWVFKTDISGNIQWSRGWDEASKNNSLTAVEQFSKGAGYFMVGTDERYGITGHMLALRTKPDGSGNFTCPMPLISPRVLTATRTLSNISPPFVSVTGSGNATFTGYGFASAVAVCCCDNWANNCPAGVLDIGGGVAMQVAVRGDYVDVDWAFEDGAVNAYEIWSGPNPAAMDLAYSFEAAVHSLSDPIRGHGLRYYQVRALDANGAQLGSEMRSVVLGEDRAMWLESNGLKSGEVLKLHFAGEPGTPQPWEVTDLSGRRMVSGSVQLGDNGQAVEWLSTSGWAAGVYVVRGWGAALRAVVR